jgi:hypothetical protein
MSARSKNSVSVGPGKQPSFVARDHVAHHMLGQVHGRAHAMASSKPMPLEAPVTTARGLA